MENLRFKFSLIETEARLKQNLARSEDPFKFYSSNFMFYLILRFIFADAPKASKDETYEAYKGC